MSYNITSRVIAAREYYDNLLDERIKQISSLSGVPESQMVKINPTDFIEYNSHLVIDGYEYKEISEWIEQTKTGDDVYLISPLDAVNETAAQISYKSNTQINRTIRASKCDAMPVPKNLALDFFRRNHRQSLPNFSKAAVCFGLVYKNELVAVMMYDVQNGAVRGQNMDYELLRLAISKGSRVHGGASKLQAVCEDTLRTMGVTKIYSYSNATINTGAVYEKLGFTGSKVVRGQPFVIMEDNTLERLITLYPNSTDEKLARKGRLKTHIGGNKMWVKNI